MAKKSKSFWDRFKDSVVSLGDESAGPARKKPKKAAAKKRSTSKSRSKPKAKKRTTKKKR